MSRKRMFQLLIFCFIFIFIWGCAAGRKHDFSYTPEKGQNIGNGKTVLVLQVADKRPEVVQGKEDPNWVGWQRSGFGIPFDITTSDGKPFAEKVTEVIIKDISSVGFVCKEKKLDELTKEKIGRAAKEANAEKALHVVMKMFHSDTIQNIDMEWDFQVMVYDSAGNIVKTNEEKGTTELEGARWNPMAAAEKAVPKFLHSVIRKLIVGNNEIMKALVN